MKNIRLTASVESSRREVMVASTNLHDVKLPNELFGLIVAKLSLLHIFQLRLVCQHWNATLRDIDFLEEHFQLAKRAPMYVWRTEDGYATYDPESNSWQRWPKSFFLMDESWYKISSRDNGLLLVESGAISTIAFYVSNPMTRSYKKLSEDRHVWSDRAVTRSYQKHLNARIPWPTRIIFDESSKSYKIIGEDSVDYLDHFYKFGRSSGYFAFVYDSEHECWKSCGGCGGSSHYFGIPTFHQGVLHCLVTHYATNVECLLYHRHHTIYRYEDGVGLSLLSTYSVADQPKDMLFVHMFEWQGNLLLVGGKRINEHCVSSVKIWQLDTIKNDETENLPSQLDVEKGYMTMPPVWRPIWTERYVWTETMTMPDNILFRFSPPVPMLHLQFSCSNSAQYVYFTSFSEDYMFARLFACDLSTDIWWELPELLHSYKRSCKSDSSGVFGSFLWKPSFDKLI